MYGNESLFFQLFLFSGLSSDKNDLAPKPGIVS